MNMAITILLFLAVIVTLGIAIYLAAMSMRMANDRNERTMARSFVRNLRETRDETKDNRTTLFVEKFGLEKPEAEVIADRLIKLEESLYAVFFRIFINGDTKALSEANKPVEDIINSCCTTVSDYVQSSSSSISSEQEQALEKKIENLTEDNNKLKDKHDNLKLEFEKLEKEKEEMEKESEKVMSEYLNMYANKRAEG